VGKGASPQDAVVTRESGVSSIPRALDSITGVSGILDRPVKPDDDGLGKLRRNCSPEVRHAFARNKTPNPAIKRISDWIELM
jgi:hypothetical protein